VKHEIPEAWLREAIRLNGLFAGMCEPGEYEYLIEAGLLRKVYEGAGGLLGLAKLRLTASTAGAS
jgi:hypothetical protein